MQIAVFGLGFVGLTAALGFADRGFIVRGFDSDFGRAAEIAGGAVPFYEPGLREALDRTAGKRFFIERDAAAAVRGCDCALFCVGTPGRADGSADLTHIFAAIDSVAAAVDKECVFVIKSTIPPGTLNGRVLPYIRAKGLQNPLAVNPEFLREGKCWEDFTRPDRIVLGVDDDAAKAALAKLYASFDAPLYFVLPNTAEFIKYLSNSLLATLVSYANEMALLAAAVGGIEVASAFRVLHEDRRLAGAGINAYIYPGCGYGGYCLPKDTAALSALGRAVGSETRIIDGVTSLNEAMPQLTAAKIKRAAGGGSGKIGVLGLSFKPLSDDVRDSSAAKIIAALIADGYRDIIAYDPVATSQFQQLYGLNINYSASARAVCEACDTIALVTAWEEFHGLDREYPDKRWVDCRYCL